MRISFLIPAYNERPTILEVLEQIEALGLDRQLIVVDDGSTDGTIDLLREWEAGRDGVVIVRQENKGKGAAIRAAIPPIDGEIAVIQDADMEYDPADIPALVEPIERGMADVVFGSRLSGGKPQRAYLFWHLVGNRFLSLLTGLLYNTTLSDMETGYKAFRSDVLRSLDLRQDDFSIEPEITAKICKRNSASTSCRSPITRGATPRGRRSRGETVSRRSGSYSASGSASRPPPRTPARLGGRGALRSLRLPGAARRRPRRARRGAPRPGLRLPTAGPRRPRRRACCSAPGAGRCCSSLVSGRRSPLASSALLIGYLFNSILPARAGELARVLALGSRAGLSRTQVLATVVLERAFDVIVLVALLVVSAPFLPSVDWLNAAVALGAVAGAALIGAAVLVRRYGVRGARVFAAARRMVAGGRAGAGRGHGEGLCGRDSWASLRAGSAVRALAVTLVSWLVLACSIWLLLLGTEMDASFGMALLILIATNLVLVLPSGPAAVGTFEAALRRGSLAAYGVDGPRRSRSDSCCTP